MRYGTATRADRRAAFFMLLPFMLFFCAFVLYAILTNLYYSFTNYNFGGAARFAGFGNYARMARDGDFLISLKNTFVYAFFSVAFLTAFGLAAAVATNGAARALKAARALMVIPYATSAVAAALVWLLLFDPGLGAVNKLLAFFGARPGWLYDAGLALPTLVIMNVWKNTGYVAVIFLAGLQTVPGELYEAAVIDGANAWRRFISVTLPQLAPVTLFVLITCCVEAFKTFEQVKLMTKGGPMLRTSTVVYQIYIRAFEDFQMGYAAAQSVALLAVVLLVTMVNLKFFTGRGRG